MINKDETIALLNKLKLTGMATCYRSVLDTTLHEQPSAHQLVAMMVQSEEMYRTHKKTEQLLRVSKLRYDSTLQHITYDPQRNLTREQVLFLSDCNFINRAENILITGATGCGKSYLACALGRQACTLGYKTLYFGLTRLIERVVQSKLEGTFSKLLDQFSKTDLLILDDFGLVPIDQSVRLALLQILEDRYKNKGIIIASQLPFENWWEYLADQTLADAIMDRLAASAHKIELKGNSLRNKNYKKNI